MEKETTIWESILIISVLVVILSPSVRLIYQDIQEERNKDVVQACINGVFASQRGQLPEDLNLYYGTEIDSKDLANYLEYTNATVNELKAYINCVDSDLLQNR